jgi:hypothetical protein
VEVDFQARQNEATAQSASGKPRSGTIPHDLRAKMPIVGNDNLEVITAKQTF